MVRLHQHQGVGPEEVQQVAVTPQVPVPLRLVEDFPQVALHVVIADMPAETLEQAQVGPEQMVDGGLVRLGDVVVLQEGVDGQLPVHRPADVPGIEDHVIVQGEAVEVGEDLLAEEGVQIQRRPR
ncbi:hypothetical protein D9M71_407170 [compost metagenome]